MAFPVLLLCDEKGEYIEFNENELVEALEKANDEDVFNFTPTHDEEPISFISRKIAPKNGCPQRKYTKKVYSLSLTEIH